MEKVIIFKANDGKKFDDEDDCIKYETVVEKLNNVMNELPPLPKDDNCNFSNGEGYIQHDENVYRKVVEEFYDLAKTYHTGLIAPYGSYTFWRTLDDSISPFYRYGYRLLNIDINTLREYGQGYYKNNPDKVKGGRIN